MGTDLGILGGALVSCKRKKVAVAPPQVDMI